MLTFDEIKNQLSHHNILFDGKTGQQFSYFKIHHTNQPDVIEVYYDRQVHHETAKRILLREFKYDNHRRNAQHYFYLNIANAINDYLKSKNKN